MMAFFTSPPTFLWLSSSVSFSGLPIFWALYPAPCFFTVATDIVDYIHAARTFGGEDLGDVASHGRYQGRVLAIPDRAGEVVAPMLLTIGTANRLRLVRRDRSGLGGGWKTVDLNAGGTSTVTVVSSVPVSGQAVRDAVTEAGYSLAVA